MGIHAGQNAVAANVGVQNGDHALFPHTPAQLFYAQPAALLPAAGAHEAVAGVEGHDDVFGVPAGDGGLDQLRLFDGGGAQNDALSAGLQGSFYVIQGADAAAKLQARADLCQAGQCLPVGGAPFGEGAVQVDDVQPLRAGRCPALGGAEWVLVKDGLPVGVAQLEAHDLAGAEVYGGVDGEGKSVGSHEEASRLEIGDW